MEGGSVIPVRVAVRVRPLAEKEVSNGCKDLARIIPGRPQIQLEQADKTFTYDYAFGQGSCQDDVFGTAVKPLVDQLFKGYNATVLAYGQTGSGKTHTMGTCSNESTPSAVEGIIPKAVREIFKRIGEMQDYMFSVRIAFIELYKEQLYDLLSAQAKKEDAIVDLREDPKMGFIVANLTEVPVNGLESTLKQLEVGSLKRVTAATAMNKVSSRSHAIFTLTIEGTRNLENETDGEDDENQPRSINAKFHLVDLAGSESTKKTMATGVRYMESVSINLGLLSLGNVISALGKDGSQRSHIPYRDSKLTRLLQDSLGGNSYTLMIACISPADDNLDETLITLRYADRARKIKNKPIINRDDDNEKQISDLKKQLSELRAQFGRGGAFGLNNEEKVELEELKDKYSSTANENSELKMALNDLQEETNEKFIAIEMMKTRLKELTEAAIKRSDSKDELNHVLGLMLELLTGEKSLIEVTRSECNNNLLQNPKDDEENSKEDVSEDDSKDDVSEDDVLYDQDLGEGQINYENPYVLDTHDTRIADSAPTRIEHEVSGASGGATAVGADFLAPVGASCLAPASADCLAPEVPNSLLHPRTKIKFDKGRFLGKGGFAKYYEMKDLSSGKFVACKVVPKLLLVKYNQFDKMAQETLLHHSLSHHHVIKLLDSYDDSDFFYVFLELCGNRSLMELHKRRKAITEPETRYFMNQILFGVKYLHDNKIIHRDLKLGNIFLSDEMEIKLSGFSEATKVDSDDQINLAPEILAGNGHSYEVDLWSIGCIFYTLLVGRHPFESQTIEATSARIKRDEYQVPSNVGPSAKELIIQLLRSSPDQRPTINETLKHDFLIFGYMPPRLPASCLTMAPRFDTKSDKSLIASKEPYSGSGSAKGAAAPVKVPAKDDISDWDCDLRDIHTQLESVLANKPATPNMEDEAEDPKFAPLIWVSKWVDYSDKYGFGYALSDDSIGVVFNDLNKLLLLADGSNMHYIGSDGSEKYYSKKKFPSKLDKKVKLLDYFMNYMKKHLLKAGANIQVRDGDELSRIPSMKKWFRTSEAVFMLLTNGTLQINFFKDHTKIIFDPIGGLTFVDEKKTVRTYSLESIKRVGCPHDLYHKMPYLYEKLGIMIKNIEPVAVRAVARIFLGRGKGKKKY